MSGKIHDLGNGYTFEFTDWAPDRSIPANNERFKDIPDIKPVGMIIRCPHGNRGYVIFDVPHAKELFGDVVWTLKSLVPIHIEPSIRFMTPPCCHGFVRNGRWENA